MRQKVIDILSDFFRPLQNYGVVLLALGTLVIALWGIMVVVRLAIG